MDSLTACEPRRVTSHRSLRAQRPAGRLAFAVLIALVTSGLVGCKSVQMKRPGIEGYNELIRHQQEALALEEAKQPTIYFRGAVQKPVVAWREDLTLAEGLLEAGYASTFSPHAIRVTRAGRSYNIDVQRLLRGTDNPVLLPGDVVEVFR